MGELGCRCCRDYPGLAWIFSALIRTSGPPGIDPPSRVRRGVLPFGCTSIVLRNAHFVLQRVERTVRERFKRPRLGARRNCPISRGDMPHMSRNYAAPQASWDKTAHIWDAPRSDRALGNGPRELVYVLPWPTSGTRSAPPCHICPNRCGHDLVSRPGVSQSPDDRVEQTSGHPWTHPRCPMGRPNMRQTACLAQSMAPAFCKVVATAEASTSATFRSMCGHNSCRQYLWVEVAAIASLECVGGMQHR
jgi:hypothetical protein